MEEKNAALLLKPSEKQNSQFERQYPFPIVTTKCKENASDPDFKIAEGYLGDGCVNVFDEESMKRIYTMGFFGKGTLSKNAPKICLQEKTTEVEEPRSTTSSPVDAIIDVVDIGDEDSKSQPNYAGEDVTTDSERSLRKKKKEEKESLQLSFEEAYFLSYGLGCLVVKDKDKMLKLSALWKKFCELTPSGNFPVMYTAYHHFRSKGWIVKNGLKFGTDYVLYKDGPPFYHATYSVMVRYLRESLREVKGNRDLTWASMAALNRVNSNAGKGLLILYVIKPVGLPEDFQSTPYCMSQFRLEEVLYTRWVAEENR